MNIRDALIQQRPSLELQRAASDEIARLDARIKELECITPAPDGYTFQWNRGIQTYGNGLVDQIEASAEVIRNDWEHALDRGRIVALKIIGEVK